MKLPVMQEERHKTQDGMTSLNSQGMNPQCIECI